jgi:hypothetical protein
MERSPTSLTNARGQINSFQWIVVFCGTGVDSSTSFIISDINLTGEGFGSIRVFESLMKSK